MENNISTAIKAAVESAPERKFVESVDFAFTIKDVDLKNPNNPRLPARLIIKSSFRFTISFVFQIAFPT